MENFEDSVNINQINNNVNNYIFEYDNYLINIYQNLNNNYERHRGYLIDRNKFEEYKKILKYYIYLKGENEYQLKSNEFDSNLNSTNIKQFEKVEFKSPNDLLDKLLNNNEYTLINVPLWQSICINGKENEDFIYYYINKSNLYFTLNNEKIYFKHNKNILDINSFIYDKNENAIKDKNNINDNNNVKRNINNNIDSNNINNNEEKDAQINNNINDHKNNNDKILYLIDIMMKFYLFKKKFINDPNINDTGYLIDKKEIDKWKKSTNYENIEYNFFDKYLKDNSEFSNEQKDEIINYIKNNNFDLNNKIQIESLNFKSKEELESFHLKNSIVLINREIFWLINDKKEIKENEIKYSIDNKTINLYFDNSNITYKLEEGNIIYAYLYTYFYTLITNFYFEEELKTIINTEKHNEPIMIFIIDKKLISKYKEQFNYHILCKYLKEEKKIEINNLNEIIYMNQNKINKIIENIPEKYIDSLPQFSDLNKYRIELNKIAIDKIQLINGKNMNYVNNFEIVNTSILLKLCNNKNNPVMGRCYFIKKKLLLIFEEKENNTYYGELGYINEQNSFIIEYLIDLNSDKKQFEQKCDFDPIFKEMDKDHFLDIIYSKKSFNYKLNEKINIFFYEIKKNNNIVDPLNIKTNLVFKCMDNKNKNEINNRNDKLKQILEILLNFYKHDKKLKLNNNNLEETFFIVKLNWIQNFKSIFNYDYFLENVQNILNEDDSNSNLIKTIMEKDPNNIIFKYSNDTNEIENKLNDLNIYQMPDQNDNNILLNYKYGLIDKEIIDCLKNINININERLLEKVKCIFLENKIFIIFEGKKEPQLNIGYY